MSAGTCRSPGCAAPIRWVTLENGKRHPVNPDPVTEVNPGLVAVSKDPWSRAFVVKKNTSVVELVERELYVSHYATCTDAEKWRKR